MRQETRKRVKWSLTRSNLNQSLGPTVMRCDVALGRLVVVGYGDRNGGLPIVGMFLDFNPEFT